MTIRAARSTILLLLLGLLATPAVGREHAKKPRRPGVVIFKVRADAGSVALARLAAVLQTRGAVPVRRLAQLGARLERFAGREMSEESRCAELLATGAVAYAEPDYLVAPGTTPDDPKFSLQWQHTKIGSAAAWNTTTGSSSVLIGVCDTGISSTHPDLVGNLVLPGYNAVDGTTNTEPVYNHGTGVAGCIGAVGNNGAGVAGVVWTAGILPIRITNQSDGRAYVSDAADGIRWAADRGAKVVNLSYLMAGYSTIDSAAQYLRSKGGLLFVAAGNDSRDPGWTDFSSFVAVSATSSSDVLASWSNRGTYVDLAAPGVGVYSTTGTSSYSSMSGTSFASPIAAGVAALIYSVDSTFSPTEVESFLFSSCVDLGSVGEDDLYGNGRVDAEAAVALASDTTPNLVPVADASATPTSGTAPLVVTFDGSGSTDADGTIRSYSWDFGDGASGSGSTASHTYTEAGTWTATLTVTDDRGAIATDTVGIAVAQDPTNLVHVAGIAMSWAVVPGGWTGQAVVTVLDASGDPRPGAAVTGQWSGGVAGTALGTTDVNGKATLVSKKTRGSATLTLTVTDVSAPGYAYDSANNTVTSNSVSGGDANSPPTAVATAAPTSGGAPLVVDFDGRDSDDADGSVVSYAWDFGDGSTTASGGSVTHIYQNIGTFTAQLTVTDDEGATDTAEVVVSVLGDPTKVVHVESIEIDLLPGRSGDVPTATVVLAALDGDSCVGATVTGTWSGIVSGDVTGTADADGTVLLSAKKTKKTGTITLTITGISLPGYVFDTQLGVPTASIVKASRVR